MDVGAVVAWFLDPAHWSGSNGVPIRILEHVGVSTVALAIGAGVALPAGLAIGHTGRGERVAVAVAGLGRAVPSYALLILFVPLFGLGFASAVPALVLLSVPPILVNAVAGLRDVDAETIEAGRGMGMTEWQVLRDVELPAAMPAILAGFRTSAVQVVATATLAAVVAGGGLGRYIVDGFAVQRYDRLVAGALLVAVLALLTERAFAILQRTFERRGGRPAEDVFGPMGPSVLLGS